MCLDNQVAGNTPPAGNGPDVVSTTPHQATEDASDEPLVREAEKWRARCQGPSCEVAVSANHCLYSTTRPAVDARGRSTLEAPDSSRAVEAANVSCVHNDAGRMATNMLMHLPATRCSVREKISLASSAWRNRNWSLSSLSCGTRKVAVPESHNLPKYCCTVVGFKSHFDGERNWPHRNDTSIATWVASAAASHCTRAAKPCVDSKLLYQESPRNGRAGIP